MAQTTGRDRTSRTHSGDGDNGLKEAVVHAIQAAQQSQVRAHTAEHDTGHGEAFKVAVQGLFRSSSAVAPTAHEMFAVSVRYLADEQHAQLIEELINSDGFHRLPVADPPETARAMTASLRAAPDGWAEILGPCYTLSGLAERRGVTRSAVSKRAVKNRLLRVLDDEGHALFPSFALTEELEPIDGLHETLSHLQESGYSEEPSTWAWWLRTPHPDLEGREPIVALREGVPIAAVLEAIDRDAGAVRAA